MREELSQKEKTEPQGLGVGGEAAQRCVLTGPSVSTNEGKGKLLELRGKDPRQGVAAPQG